MKGGKDMLACIAEWHKVQSAKKDAAVAPADVKCPKCGAMVSTSLDKCPVCKSFMPGHTLNGSDAQDSKDDVIQQNRQALKDLYSLTEIFT
jgi:hypothetical protein